MQNVPIGYALLWNLILKGTLCSVRPWSQHLDCEKSVLFRTDKNLPASPCREFNTLQANHIAHILPQRKKEHVQETERIFGGGRNPGDLYIIHVLWKNFIED